MAVVPTVIVRVPSQVLVLAVRCALAQRTADVALTARAVRDQAGELPAEVLADLDNRITLWLAAAAGRAARFDTEPWRAALVAVRRARQVGR